MPSYLRSDSRFLRSILFLYVGLNHYLGENYPPYGYFPDYLRVRKIPARVIPDIVETLLHRDFPYAPECDYPTVLSRILYEGVLVEAVMQIAGVSEQTALGYDDQQMEWLNKNEHKLWEEIVGRKYLFSSDRATCVVTDISRSFHFCSRAGSPGGGRPVHRSPYHSVASR